MGKLFFPWRYEDEAAEANVRSGEGFHLVKRSLLSKKEEEDASVRYRYVLDCAENGNFTELLYEKQGWELVCSTGAWRWFRKRLAEGAPESEYVIHGPARHAVEDHLHSVIRPLDAIRNLLLIVAFVLVLIPGAVTHGWTPRIACLPLFLCIPIVKYAENIRKVLGEDKRK